MTTTKEESKSTESKLFLINTILACLLIMGVGAAIVFYIYQTEPTATRVTATKKTAMSVEVIQGKPGDFRPSIEALGTVRPAREIILRPRVRGVVLKLDEDFTPGGYLEKDKTVVWLDPSDYKNDLKEKKSQLRQAEANLKIEMGRQNVAQSEYELLEEKLSEENKALVLRKPQLNSSRASVEMARAAVEQAQLELNRTAIKAPFDAQLLRRRVNVGSQVSPGDELAHLVGIDTYWIEVTVPLSKLRWLTFEKGESGRGTEARIRNRRGWGEKVYRTGHLYKLVGNLEEKSRMARVLVAVNDPLAREKGSEGLPPLIIGSYVEVSIEGKKISSALRLPRNILRKNNTLFINNDGKLEIRKVDVLYKDEKFVYIRKGQDEKGLDKKDQVVTTDLTTVVKGAKLRIKESSSSKMKKSKEKEGEK